MKTRRNPIKAPEMGRVKKIKGLPAEMRRACRNDLSRIGPKTNARIRGPGSISTFLKR
jgi:hypothetical protein